MFEKELVHYKKIQARLQAENPKGGFVVIKGETVLGVWISRQEATKQAADVYGSEAYLVKNINENI